MLKRIILISLLAIYVVSCENSIFNNEDNNYPTVINAISPDELSQLQSDFFQRNKYIITSLNNFGFCASGSRDIDPPPALGPLYEMEAEIRIRNFISRNLSCVGVNNVDEITFTKLDSSNYNLNTIWFAVTPNQRIDTIEVLNTKIVFRILNRHIRMCSGNWYPDVNIPKVFNFSAENAKSLLVDRVVTHNLWGDEFEVTITQENINDSNVRLVINPVRTESEITLHVAWEVIIPGFVYYLIYVDVMSGEVIEEVTTIG